jgi:hypothetical protein
LSDTQVVGGRLGVLIAFYKLMNVRKLWHVSSVSSLLSVADFQSDAFDFMSW